MKRVIQFSALFLICGTILFSWVQTKSPEKGKDLVVQNSNEETEKLTKQERHPTSIFPFFIAGTIGIIQKVYIRKED